MRMQAQTILSWTLFVLCPAFAEDGVSLSLNSTANAQGNTVSLELSVNTTGPQLPTAIQWTIEYAAENISSVEVVAGPTAISGDKTLVCNPSAGSIKCIAYGMNVYPIFNGVVATVE